MTQHSASMTAVAHFALLCLVGARTRPVDTRPHAVSCCASCSTQVCSVCTPSGCRPESQCDGTQTGLHAASGVLQPDALPFEGLELGPLVGRGSFGRVYRGRWQDKTVAVKVRARRTTQRLGPALLRFQATPSRAQLTCCRATPASSASNCRCGQSWSQLYLTLERKVPYSAWRVACADLRAPGRRQDRIPRHLQVRRGDRRQQAGAPPHREGPAALHHPGARCAPCSF